MATFMESSGGFTGEVPPLMDKSRARMDQLTEQASKPDKVGGIETYRYPLNIDNFNTDNDAPVVYECVHFTAIKQGGISFEDTAREKSAQAAITNQIDNTSGKGASNKWFADKNIKEMSGSYVHPATKKLLEAKAKLNQQDTENSERSTAEKGWEEMKSGLNTMGTMFQTQKKQVQSDPESLAHCFLYMPASVQEGLGASWGVESLGAVGHAVHQGIRGGNVDDIMKNFTGGAISDLAKSVALAAGATAGAFLAKNAVIGALGAAAMFGGVGAGLQMAGRFTQNPFEEQLFNGIGFREFQFDFAFVPRNETEGMQIAEIIKMFRLNSRPNFVNGFMGQGLYTFPNEFAIEFMKNDGGGSFVRNKSLPKLYNCVCTNVQTNYTPEGFWTALRDGTPVSYGLTLAFTETKKITQEDVLKDY